MVAKQDAVCTECNPPKRFKSIPGLNGHMQFKHSKGPPTMYVNNGGRQAKIYEEMSDRLDQVLEQQEEILELFRRLYNGQATGNSQGNGNGQATGNGQGNGNGQATGNGNGNGNGQGNGNGLANRNLTIEDVEEPQKYDCANCKGSLKYRQKYCPTCNEDIDWHGV
jgi:hypothetical protein